MGEPSVDDLVADLLRGDGDPAAVPPGLVAEVAERLGDQGAVQALSDLATRSLPRLVKKERFDQVEAVWIACCAAGALPWDVMVKAADRMAARGQGAQADEHLAMLVEALAGAGRFDEAVAAAREAMAIAPSASVAASVAPALQGCFPDAPNLEEALARLRAPASPGGAELAAAERALRFAPGCFLQLQDYTIAQVVVTDGVEARVRHPSGAEESRRVDGTPGPRVLAADSQEVRRLFDLDGLRRSWVEDPLACLGPLLVDQGGSIATTALKAMLVPRIVADDAFDGVLATLKAACTAGEPALPSYDSRRRLFVAPGAEAPVAKKRPQRPKAEGEEPSAPGPRRTATPRGPSGPVEVHRVQPRWVDLTALAEVRALVSRVEEEVTELVRELNVDLPVRLEEARAHGDLRENAEYDAAKERLAYVQARIEQLRERLGQLHELSRVRVVPGKVTVMSRVTVAVEGGEEERTLRITPAELPNPRPGDVSAGTPYGKALLGKEAGEVALVRLPRRTERLEVLAVRDPDEPDQASGTTDK